MGPRAGLDVCGKSRPPTGIGSPDLPARSQSLYRLSYRAYYSEDTKLKFSDKACEGKFARRCNKRLSEQIKLRGTLV